MCNGISQHFLFNYVSLINHKYRRVKAQGNKCMMHKLLTKVTPRGQKYSTLDEGRISDREMASEHGQELHPKPKFLVKVEKI